MASRVVLGLGSNLGDRVGNLRRAVSGLIERTGAGLEAESRLYASPAWGMKPGSPDFINAAILVTTSMGPEELLGVVHDVEKSLGRDRADSHGRVDGQYADRTIDIDILAWDDRVINLPGLRVPHPGLAGRRWALEPFLDVWQDWVHPETGLELAEMLRACRETCAEPLEERL
ncbi:MAG: 2-amino-4-hydroxy-6-hydroxymethyldihydropteridine diphosphokinase [Deltaproteobacteria bacterium]|nr:2-amino-4-hydroxy-6-hydroxymethyldihydropteridine diphosphokinase [Deltaproteobacteria bacterium]